MDKNSKQGSTETDPLQEIQTQLAPESLAGEQREEIKSRVEALTPTIQSLAEERQLANCFGMAALHPDPHVRYYMLHAATERLDSVFARQYLISQTHADDDYIAFEAIRLCGELGLQESIEDLVSIVSWPSRRLSEPGKPVGVGFATGSTAIERIFDAESQEELSKLEDYFEENGHLPVDRLEKPSLHAGRPGPDDLPVEDPDPPEGMVFVPGGTRTIGIDGDRLDFDRFDTSDASPAYEMYVPPFYIDKYPVTVEEYERFLEATTDDDTDYGHPGEPDDKDRTPNTFRESVGADHPITGIDYYDAYAYAQWADKDLPTEEEWETAARGSEGRLFPWGEEFDGERLNWAGAAFDTEIDSVEEWRRVVRKDGVDPHETRTTPVTAHPEGASEYGVEDLLGNAWEYTKTNFLTRQEMYPAFTHQSPHSHEGLVDNTDAFPVIRGGTWSSIPEMTTTVFRGKDLMTDRHNEIGFRCVRRV